jgi:sugar phosphate isomerase/epimerase
MRLGAPIEATTSPEEWIKTLKRYGYRAAYCPIKGDADSATRRAYAEAAQQADILIAEVGVWNNPISPDDAIRKAAIEKCQTQLALADEIGARCCVNISGSRSEQWDAPHADNMTPATFDLIVETVRHIIDAVQPTRTFYTLEPMPFMYPDSVDCYLDLIDAIDRSAFAVHFDPTNLINSPHKYYNNKVLLQDAFQRLGAHIRCCHAKDILLGSKMTVHLEEALPGQGNLDYRTFLAEAHRADPNMPIMLEHFPLEAYPPAVEFVRKTAQELDIDY